MNPDDLIENDSELQGLHVAWEGAPDAWTKGEFEYQIDKRQERLAKDFWKDRQQDQSSFSVSQVMKTLEDCKPAVLKPIPDNWNKVKVLEQLDKQRTILGGIDICFVVRDIGDPLCLIRRIRVRMCRFDDITTTWGRVKQIVAWRLEDAEKTPEPISLSELHFQGMEQYSDDTVITRLAEKVLIRGSELPRYIDVLF